MENKQTAVEWAEDELSKLNSAVVNMEITTEEYHNQRVRLWEKAKQLEEQQIKNAVIFGINHGSDESRVFGLDARPYASKQGALYINQTYKTNGK